LPSWQIKNPKNKIKEINKFPLNETKKDLKRKCDLLKSNTTPNKKLKTTHPENTNLAEKFDSTLIDFQPQENIDTFVPFGFQWDNNNWSCAYDSLFFILFNTLIASNIRWKFSIYNINDNTKYMLTLLNKYQLNLQYFNLIRDKMHAFLHNANSKTFPYGKTGTAVVNVALYIFNYDDINLIYKHKNFPIVHEYVFSYKCNSIAIYINNRYLDYVSHHQNPHIMSSSLIPPILIISLNDLNIYIDKEFIIDNKYKYRLIGIIYYGQYHFIS